MRQILKPCARPGCGGLVERGFCRVHQQTARALCRVYETHRGNSNERGYDAAWRRFRALFLNLPENVLCADCGLVMAVDVHHVAKVRMHPELRLVATNCRALCHGCHSARTLAGE